MENRDSLFKLFLQRAITFGDTESNRKGEIRKGEINVTFGDPLLLEFNGIALHFSTGGGRVGNQRRLCLEVKTGRIEQILLKVLLNNLDESTA